jgi:hypothetical protein
MAEQKQNLMTGPLPFFIISGYLILTAARRLLVTANEYPPREAQILEMVIDGASIVCLIGLFAVVSKTIKRDDRAAVPIALLFLVALVAGITLFGIRFTSDAAWWTGHLNYALD